MMWFGIISFAIIILGWFLYDRRKMEKRIKAEGGMRVKYETLINLIMKEDDRTKIIKEDNTYIATALSSFAATTTFELLATFKTVTITYRTKSVLFGSHKLNWDFPKEMNQEQMFFNINKDIYSYMEKLDLEKTLQKKGSKKLWKLMNDNLSQE